MSGLEIAGLVLSTIPIVLLGLREAQSRRSQVLFKHQLIIDAFIWQLEMEHAQFRSTLEKIMGELVGELELAALLNDQDHPRWRDAALGRAMKQKIGQEAYEYYMKTVRRVAMDLAALGEVVQLKQGKAST